MKYKLIVSDMDGTLLGDNHKITEENKIALSKALEKGVKIVPASGRIYNSAREHFDFLDINTPLCIISTLLNHDDVISISSI